MIKNVKNIFIGMIVGIMLMFVSTPVLADSLLKTIEVSMNSVNLTVNGQQIIGDNFLYNRTTYIPLRLVADALGKDVGWDENTKTVSINDKGYDIEEKKEVNELSENENYNMESDFNQSEYEKFKNLFEIAEPLDLNPEFPGMQFKIAVYFKENPNKIDYDTFINDFKTKEIYMKQLTKDLAPRGYTRSIVAYMKKKGVYAHQIIGTSSINSDSPDEVLINYEFSAKGFWTEEDVK